MKLNTRALSLAAGITWGFVIFLITNISLLRGGQGEHLSKLAQFYIGYSFSFLGSIIGLVWGFVTMFIVGWVFAWLYNKFLSTPPTQSQ